MLGHDLLGTQRNPPAFPGLPVSSLPFPVTSGTPCEVQTHNPGAKSLMLYQRHPHSQHSFSSGLGTLFRG